MSVEERLIESYADKAAEAAIAKRDLATVREHLQQADRNIASLNSRLNGAADLVTERNNKITELVKEIDRLAALLKKLHTAATPALSKLKVGTLARTELSLALGDCRDDVIPF